MDVYRKGNKSNGCSSKTTSGDSDSGEEQDEPSSSLQQKKVEDALTSFREKWQKELQPSSKNQNDNITKAAKSEGGNYENNARALFLEGAEMEKAGKLYEAIQYYRRAVQIVPDIEFRIDNGSKSKQKERQITEESENGNNETTDESSSSSEGSDDEEIKDGELFARIQKKYNKDPSLCHPKFEQTATHIREIPVEIILYILRWVVSSDLDLRSLEMFAAVCRGFYLCARDPEIWRLACLRVWGLNCGIKPGIYESWREMFLNRSRIHFNGCYISKTTYMRNGENSFQDQFYRPWHLVVYYRYLRFFPEGKVLMLTSADEPVQCVSLMKSRNARDPIMSGHYRLKDDKVTLVVQREDKIAFPVYKKLSRRRDAQDGPMQTFHMELQIKNHNQRRHAQLVWTHYSVSTKPKKGVESTCSFDLLTNRYPPLWFSRVKSFTAESDNPLL